MEGTVRAGSWIQVWWAGVLFGLALGAMPTFGQGSALPNSMPFRSLGFDAGAALNVLSETPAEQSNPASGSGRPSPFRSMTARRSPEEMS